MFDKFVELQPVAFSPIMPGYGSTGLAAQPSALFSARGVLVGRDQNRQLWLCGGYVPCGDCSHCHAAQYFTCDKPIRPDWSMLLMGEPQKTLSLPSDYLTPLSLMGGESFSPEALAASTVLLATAGLVYQAKVFAGMSPGDVVIVNGPVGPGNLPLQILAEAGLKPILLTSNEPEDHEISMLNSGRNILMPVAMGDLPSSRCHLLDICPSNNSIPQWLQFSASCLSCTFVDPYPLSFTDIPFNILLAGQTTIRWVRDLHPHLVLEIATIALQNRIEITPWLECHSLPSNHEILMQILDSVLLRHRWPVFML